MALNSAIVETLHHYVETHQSTIFRLLDPLAVSIIVNSQSDNLSISIVVPARLLLSHGSAECC